MLTKSIYSQILLEDDDTSTGGVTFQGETLEDFLEELDYCQTIRTIKDVNNALIECGIKPINALPEDHEIIGRIFL